MRYRLGELREAEQDYDQALSIYKQLAADFPARPEFRQRPGQKPQQPGRSAACHGPARRRRRRTTTEALSIQKQLAADFPTRPEFRQELAGSHNNRGALLRDTGRLKEAEAGLRPGPEHPEATGRRLPHPARVPPGAGQQPQQPGHPAQRHGPAEGGGGGLPTALDLQKQLAADFPARPEFRQELAASHNNLGDPARRHGPAEGGGGGLRRRPGHPEATGRRLPRPARVPPGAGQKPQQPGHPAPRHGPAEGGGGGLRRRPGPAEAAGRRLPHPPRVPPGAGREPQQPGHPAPRHGPAEGGGGGLRRTPWTSRSNWRPTSPPAPSSARSWPQTTTTWASCSATRAGSKEAEAAYDRRPGPPEATGRRLPHPARVPPATWPEATTTWASCSVPRAGRRRRRRPTAPPWTCRSNWPPTSPPGPSSARSWPAATTTWASCSSDTGRLKEAEAGLRPGPEHPQATGGRLPHPTRVPPGAGRQPQQPGPSAA